MTEIIESKHEAARKRWKILAEALRSNKVTDTRETTKVSVQKFATFDLLHRKRLNISNDADGSWFEYSCEALPSTRLKIRHVNRRLTPNELVGFNNTGNVRIWPSEEVLTYYCLKHKEQFNNKSICEIGGGMTSLCALFIAAVMDVDDILVTDGNEASVDNIQCIVDHNDIFKNKKILCRVLRWDVPAHSDDFIEQFDYVFCSDCLFFDGHEQLAETIHKLLKAQGEAILSAPSRSQTFERFEEIAGRLFHLKRRTNYDAHIWALHEKLREEPLDVYDENVCYPLLLEMRKK